jgi:hypothetical protein
MSGYMDYTLKLAKLNSKGAEQFWQGLTGEEISIAKDEETETLDIVSDEGMKLSGTAEDIRAFMDQSSAAQSPEQLMKLAVESGISLELPGENKPETEMQTIYGPEGQTKRIPIPKGKPYTPPTGWSLAKPTAGKEEYEPGQALKRISTIRKAMAELEKTNEITAAIVAANPDLGGMFGQQMDTKLKQDLMDAWQNELDYLAEFAPKQKPKEKPKAERQSLRDRAIQKLKEKNYPITEGNITYIMDQLES